MLICPLPALANNISSSPTQTLLSRPNSRFQIPSFCRAPASADQEWLTYMELYTRSTIRNAHIYASDDLDTLLGGLWIAEGITNANLYSMLEIFCFFSETFDLQHHGGSLVARDDFQLQPGNYIIVTNGRSLPYFNY